MKYIIFLLGFFSTSYLYAGGDIKNIRVFSEEIKLDHESMYQIKSRISPPDTDYIQRIRIVRLNSSFIPAVKAVHTDLLNTCASNSDLCSTNSNSMQTGALANEGLSTSETVTFNNNESIESPITVNLFDDATFSGLSFYQAYTSKHQLNKAFSVSSRWVDPNFSHPSSILFDDDKIIRIRVVTDRNYNAIPIDDVIKTDVYGKNLYAVYEEIVFEEYPHDVIVVDLEITPEQKAYDEAYIKEFENKWL